MIEVIIKILGLTQINGAIFQVLNPAFSLSSIQIVQALSKYCNGLSTIIDVGSNIGQFALASNWKFPKSNIYCFEPVPETVIKLNKNVRNLNNIQVYSLALGNQQGEINFYYHDYSLASSSLKMSDLQKDLLLNTEKSKLIRVPISTLDEVFKNVELKHKVLLKLDVQGFEREVLNGGRKTITKSDYLLIETSFVEMYEGESTFEEIHHQLKTAGFKLLGPVGLLQAKDMQILQLDMLYINQRTAQ